MYLADGTKTPIKIEKIKILEKEVLKYPKKFRVCFIITEKREIPIQ